MDQFIVSARKYRPVTFDSVVGQRHIASTLKNAIKSGHLAQAFLFSGPRGVGKTTCARILAKTINCMDRKENIEPCDKCESCESFNEGHSLNIYELDAASNNSVDDIRSLIDQVRFAPQIGTKKVYIIDEVHMLSANAFNAFLKTLEEPPSHAIFILATTEKHKVIPTVLSRCQVFEFHRIEIEDMVRQLGGIAEKEGIKAEHDALHLIAQKSEGSLRDALSMFDQLVTYSGDSLSLTSVIENLSVLSTDYFFELTDALVKEDVAGSLVLFDKVLRKGFDGHQFILGLAEHFRNLLVAQDHSTIELLSVGELTKEKYRDQTVRVSSAYLIKGLNLLSKADINYKTSKNQRLLVEITLINLSSFSDTTIQTEVKKKTEPVKQERPDSRIPTNPSRKVEPMAEAAEKKEITQAEVLVTEKSTTETLAKSENSTPEKKTEEVKSEEKTVENSEPTSQAPEITESEEKKEEIERQDSSVTEEKPKIVSEDQPKPVEKKMKRPSLMGESISINDYTKDKKVETDEDGNELAQPERNATISDEKFNKVWNALLEHYNNKGKLSLYATLKKYNPQLTENKEIKITYDNKSQVEIIDAEKTRMLEKLRNDLGNDQLSISLSISDQKHQRAYTPAEKLQKLIEKNPNIDKLKQSLDLDHT